MCALGGVDDDEVLIVGRVVARRRRRSSSSDASSRDVVPFALILGDVASMSSLKMMDHEGAEDDDDVAYGVHVRICLASELCRRATSSVGFGGVR